jgi:hypothetical protein
LNERMKMRIPNHLTGREITILVDGFPVTGTFQSNVVDPETQQWLVALTHGTFEADRVGGWSTIGMSLDGGKLLS